ncbi:hypothetical protein N806_31145 [Rhodococcus sp. P27]|nr:hypothetical protein N806_31145 [Rhodococcus sp. P27]
MDHLTDTVGGGRGQDACVAVLYTEVGTVDVPDVGVDRGARERLVEPSALGGVSRLLRLQLSDRTGRCRRCVLGTDCLVLRGPESVGQLVEVEDASSGTVDGVEELRDERIDRRRNVIETAEDALPEVVDSLSILGLRFGLIMASADC